MRDAKKVLAHLTEEVQKMKVAEGNWRQFSSDFGSGPRIFNNALEEVLKKINEIKDKLE